MSDAVREGNTGGEERGAGPHVALPAQGVTAREAAALAAAAECCGRVPVFAGATLLRCVAAVCAAAPRTVHVALAQHMLDVAALAPAGRVPLAAAAAYSVRAVPAAQRRLRALAPAAPRALFAPDAAYAPVLFRELSPVQAADAVASLKSAAFCASAAAASAGAPAAPLVVTGAFAAAHFQAHLRELGVCSRADALALGQELVNKQLLRPCDGSSEPGTDAESPAVFRAGTKARYAFGAAARHCGPLLWRAGTGTGAWEPCWAVVAGAAPAPVLHVYPHAAAARPRCTIPLAECALTLSPRALAGTAFCGPDGDTVLGFSSSSSNSTSATSSSSSSEDDACTATTAAAAATTVGHVFYLVSTRRVAAFCALTAGARARWCAAIRGLRNAVRRDNELLDQAEGIITASEAAGPDVAAAWALPLARTMVEPNPPFETLLHCAPRTRDCFPRLPACRIDWDFGNGNGSGSGAGPEGGNNGSGNSSVRCPATMSFACQDREPPCDFDDDEDEEDNDEDSEGGTSPTLRAPPLCAFVNDASPVMDDSDCAARHLPSIEATESFDTLLLSWHIGESPSCASSEDNIDALLLEPQEAPRKVWVGTHGGCVRCLALGASSSGALGVGGTSSSEKAESDDADGGDALGCNRHQAAVVSLVATGTSVWSGDALGEVVVWEAATGAAYFRFRANLQAPAVLAAAPHGAGVYCGGSEPGTVHLWHAGTFALVRTVRLPLPRAAPRPRVAHLQCTADGTLWAAVGAALYALRPGTHSPRAVAPVSHPCSLVPDVLRLRQEQALRLRLPFPPAAPPSPASPFSPVTLTDSSRVASDVSSTVSVGFPSSNHQEEEEEEKEEIPQQVQPQQQQQQQPQLSPGLFAATEAYRSACAQQLPPPQLAPITAMVAEGHARLWTGHADGALCLWDFTSQQQQQDQQEKDVYPMGEMFLHRHAQSGAVVGVARAQTDATWTCADGVLVEWGGVLLPRRRVVLPHTGTARLLQAAGGLIAVATAEGALCVFRARDTVLHAVAPPALAPSASQRPASTDAQEQE